MQVDLEPIRVEYERELALQRGNGPRGRTLEETRARARRDGVRLHESMAPRLHAAMRTVLERLGVAREFELYSSPGGGRSNACLMWRDPILVVAIDGLGDLESQAELEYVLGHEVGHAIGGPHAEARDSAYSLAIELTCDRVGLVASRSLDAALIVEMRAAAGGWRTCLEWDPTDYVHDAYACVERLLASGNVQTGSHPEHYVRAWAITEFAKTHVYRELIGEVGGESILPLEDRIRRLLHPPQAVMGPLGARHGWDTMTPAPRPTTVKTSLEATAADALVSAAARELKAAGALARSLLTALGPPFRRLGERATRRRRR